MYTQREAGGLVRELDDHGQARELEAIAGPRIVRPQTYSIISISNHIIL